MDKIKVLAIDDSALIRELLKAIVNSDKELEMVATAANPMFAKRKIKEHNPDVITLDIEMPQMDGITFLKQIMTEEPRPVIMFSSLLEAHREVTLDALSIGAFDYVLKPKVNVKAGVSELGEELIGKIKAAYANRSKIIKKLGKKAAESTPPKTPTPKPPENRTPAKEEKPEKKKFSSANFSQTFSAQKYNADVIIPANSRVSAGDRGSSSVIVVGASTGGTEAIVKLLSTAQPGCPPILITQHMPEYFTLSFANRLNTMYPIEVREAQNGDVLKRGLCLVAPGNYHMLLKAKAGKFFVEVREGPPVNRHRPSVDVLFRSAAKYAGDKAVGIILTGMGDDGARGMKELFDTGAYTIAQDEKTSIVYGMPKEAVEHGGVSKILPLPRIYAEALSMAE